MSHSAVLQQLPSLAKPGDSHSMLTVVELDISGTQRAFEQGKQAYASHDYDQAIEFYSHALKLLHSELESVILLHRATAYEKQNKLVLAAADAKRANPTENPLTRPDPYFIHANTLLLQKKMHDAASVYKQGAVFVANTYPQRKLLAEKYHHLETFIQKYNQWMAYTLPYEVISQILSYMSAKDRLQLASTCSFWRNFMLHEWSSSMWHTIDISRMPSSQLRGLLSAIPINMPRYITLRRAVGDDMELLLSVSNTVLTVMNERKWGKIEYLETEDCGPGVPLGDVLRRNQNSMSHLTLHTWVNDVLNGRGDPLATVLSAALICPNLRYVSQHFYARYIAYQFPVIPSKLSSSSSPNNLHLTALVISYGMDEDNGLIPLLRRSPHLVSFTLNSKKYRDCTKILRVLDEHCLDLQEFNYMGISHQRLCSTNYTLPTSSSGLPLASSPTSSSSSSISSLQHTGIKNLTLQFWSMDLGVVMDDDAIGSVFRKSHTTLEKLELGLGTRLDGRHKCLDVLGSLGAPHLRTLSLDFYLDQVGSETISKLITACPSLQTVDIQGTGFWHPRIFEALASLPHLHRLWIYQKHFGSNDDGDNNDAQEEVVDKGAAILQEADDGIIRTAHWMAPVFDRAEKLVEFKYDHNDSRAGTAFISDLVPYIASSSVRKLNLENIPIDNSDALEKIISHLASSQVLHTLFVWLSFKVVENDMESFGSISNLGYLNICDAYGTITKDMVGSLLYKLQNRSRFALVRTYDPDKEYTIKGYTHGPSILLSQKNPEQSKENFVIEEYQEDE